jgi:RNA polymerase sigma-70 factor (ECF subfamily)
MKDEQQKPDDQWMRRIVETHAADLTRYAASLLGGDTDSARDVVQDAFVRLWQQPRSAIEDHVRPWLFRVCRNRAMDLNRKGARMKPLFEASHEEPQASAPGPQCVTEQRDRFAQVLSLMTELPANQREVVRLKFQNGMSYREIATVTELTVTNVGYLLHTALTTLRARMRAMGE